MCCLCMCFLCVRPVCACARVCVCACACVRVCVFGLLAETLLLNASPQDRPGVMQWPGARNQQSRAEGSHDSAKGQAGLASGSFLPTLCLLFSTDILTSELTTG